MRQTGDRTIFNFTFLWNLLAGLLGAVAGLVAGLAAAGVTTFLVKLLLNSPLPPWGWRTNIVIETVTITAACLLIFRIRDWAPWTRSLVILVAAIVIGLAFLGNGPVVLSLLNLTYFLPPCVVGVVAALGCLRFVLKRGRRTVAGESLAADAQPFHAG